jgi:hypothetical protein
VIARRAVGAVAVVAAVAVGHLVTTHLEINDGNVGPFVRTAEVGEVTHLSYADVQVTDVRFAKYVAGLSSTDYAKQAGGVFVLVAVKVTATRESTIFLSQHLVDEDDRRYEDSVRASCGINVKTKTGVPAYALFCFDVPTSRLAGMRIQLGRGSPISSSTRGDDLAEVDLGISKTHAKAGATTDDAYAPTSTSDDPIELQTVELTQEGS